MRTTGLFTGLLIGIGACIVVGPTLAAKLQWPIWVTYLVIALDGLMIAEVPYQFSEYFASARLRQRGYGEFAGGQGGGCLMFLLFGIAPVLLLGWLAWQYLEVAPVAEAPFDPGEPMATEAPFVPVSTEIPDEFPTAEVPVAPTYTAWPQNTEAPVFNNVLSFLYPADGQVLDYEGAYLFKVTPVEGAEGYLWGFIQNGNMVWENMRDEGGLSGDEYGIMDGTTAHSQFAPGYVEVWVRAGIQGNWTEPTVITIYLQPRQ